MSESKPATKISDTLIEDRRLSYAALGLLLHLLSYAPSRRLTVRELIRPGRNGRDQINTLLKELIAVGYVTKERRTIPGARGFAWVFSAREQPIQQESDDHTIVTRAHPEG